MRGPGSAGWFRVKYRARGHTVTAAVRSGRYTVLVPAHQTRYVKLVVQVLRGAPARLVRSWRVVSSAAGRGHKDAVKAVLRTVR